MLGVDAVTSALAPVQQERKAKQTRCCCHSWCPASEVGVILRRDHCSHQILSGGEEMWAREERQARTGSSVALPQGVPCRTQLEKSHSKGSVGQSGDVGGSCTHANPKPS